MRISGGGENHCGAEKIVLDSTHRTLENEAHANGGGEMNDRITACDKCRHNLRVRRGADDTLEAVITVEMRDVIRRSAGEIVDDDDIVPASDHPVGKVGSNEPGPASDQYSHLPNCSTTSR